MKTETDSKNLIKKFFFGEMTEDERIEFEDNFLANAGLFEEIKAFEDDLIEKYVRGWMNPAESSKFEQAFLTTKKRRERVEFSRQFIKQVEELKSIEAAETKNSAENDASAKSFRETLFEFFSTPKFAGAGAFALIIAFFGSWLLYQNLIDQSEFVKNDNKNVENPIKTETPVELTENNQENPGFENNRNQTKTEDNSQQSPTNTNENRNESTNKPIEEIKKTPTPIKTPIQRAAPNPVLALFPGTVRSDGKNYILKLPKTAKAATFQLNLDTTDYKNYTAQLTDADGIVVFQSGNLRAVKSKINFKIPAANLRKGDFIIKLFGKNDAGENESVADFQFRVN